MTYEDRYRQGYDDGYVGRDTVRVFRTSWASQVEWIAYDHGYRDGCLARRGVVI